MEKTVTYVRDRYNNTPIFLTENGKQHILNFFFFFTHILFIDDNAKNFIGYAEEVDPNFTSEEHLNDFKRIKYMVDHIEALLAAIR